MKGWVPARGQRYQIHRDGAFGNGSYMMINGILAWVISTGWEEQSSEPQKTIKTQTTGWALGVCQASWEEFCMDCHLWSSQTPLQSMHYCNLYSEHFAYLKKKQKKPIYKITFAYLEKQTSRTYFEVAMEIWEQACRWKQISRKMIQTTRGGVWSGLAGWLIPMIKMFVMAANVFNPP